MILRAGVAAARRFLAFAFSSAWYLAAHCLRCCCQVMFSVAGDLHRSISVDAAHVSESLSSLLLALLALSLLLLA